MTNAGGRDMNDALSSTISGFRGSWMSIGRDDRRKKFSYGVNHWWCIIGPINLISPSGC